MNVPVYTIDKGVPIPEKTVVTMPLQALEVGESFLFPLDKRGSVQSKASKIAHETTKQFTIKKMDDETARVWRIQ